MIDFSEVDIMIDQLESITCDNFNCKICKSVAGTKICPKSIIIHTKTAMDVINDALSYWSESRNEREDNS